MTSTGDGLNLPSKFDMKISSALFSARIVCLAALLFVAVRGDGRAQVTNDFPLVPTETSEAEQLKSQNVRLQAQLREAELAIERNRAEAQESARAQAAAVTEKLNSIQAALDVERKRQKEELDRQRDDLQRSNTTLFWVSLSFGCVGLFSLLGTAILQWRAATRLAQASAARGQLPAPATPALLGNGNEEHLAGKTVEASNQRLLTVIDRLERRVFELEHTVVKPATGNGAAAIEATPATPAIELHGNAARIALLLEKGQSLLDAEKPEEALVCYDEILSLHNNHPEALVKKGAALERLKQDDAALACYDRAIAADGTLTIAYLYKGGVYNRLERYNEALECYEQALRAQGGAA